MKTPNHKILFLAPTLGGGGAERQMISLATELVKLNYYVSFLYYQPSEIFYKDEIQKTGIKIDSIHCSNWIRRILKIRKYIKQNNFDTVISFLPVANFINIAARIGEKWKVIRVR